MRKHLIITILSILLAGCASNPYRDYYDANTFSPEDEATFEFLKENQEKLKSALELGIQALQSDEAEKLNLRLQNAKLLKDKQWKI